MANGQLPDARLTKSGVIVKYGGDDPIPDYEGLVGTFLLGHATILYTTLDDQGCRDWRHVHEGVYLDPKSVEEFFKELK